MKNNKLLFWSLTVALAGFLFGFDTVVISGADSALQELWNRGELFHGFIVMASALWGTVLGAIFGGIPTNRLGRKKTLIWIGIFYFVSAIGSAIANDPWIFSLFRLIGGLGVGASTVAAPAYVSEIAPPDKRGRLVALYQFNIVFGILIAFLSNYLLSGIENNAWRWMLGVEALPALIYTLMVLKVPRSPRWLLLNKNKEKEAFETLQIISPELNAADEVEKIKNDFTASSVSESIFDKSYRFPLLLAFFIAFFNQFSGINALLYYAPRIFELAGLESSSALLSSIGIGLVNLIFTITGLALIDKIGRRQLMYIGSWGYIISLSCVAVGFANNWEGMIIPVLFFVFIASHAIGQGAVIWVFISEIFPNHLRASGQSFGTGTHWVLAAIIPSLIPFLFAQVGPSCVFGFFAFMMVLQLIFVWRIMPETKGVSLEDMQNVLSKKSIF